jgi:hypothetical protein
LRGKEEVPKEGQGVFGLGIPDEETRLGIQDLREVKT